MGYREFYLDSASSGWKKGPESLRLIGVPFDGTVSYRSGTRWGPSSFRESLMNIEVFSPRYDIDLEEYTVTDLGDVKTTWSADKNAEAVRKVVEELMAGSEVPLLIVGGEHSLTFGSFRAMPKNTGLLIFDAHLDLRDEYAGLRFSHATYLRRLVDTVEPERVIHVGARAATRSEWNFARAHDFTVVDEKVMSDHNSAKKMITKALDRFNTTYVSVDLDVLDPGCAPGVGNPEAGGISVKELMVLLEPLRDVKVPCFDIVELSPPYDSGVTAAAAARVGVEIAASQIRRRKRN